MYSSTAKYDKIMPYYDNFSLPVNGEAGGVASNNEAYYSYNYGNVHFVSLDSDGFESGSTKLYDTLGPQVTWLKQDLAANKQKWTVVYFHHPPYTKGTHDSDGSSTLKRLRENLVRILERYKVDLVLNGHSHCYERSYLINGHYGLESTFSFEQHALSSSSGKNDGTSNSCPYIKNAGDPLNGIVFAVVGSSGIVGGSATGYPHNAMYYSNITTGGAIVLEIENNRLDAKWIGSDGLIRDNFTILKDVENNCTGSSTSSTSSSASENIAYETDKTDLHLSVKAVPNPFNNQTQLKISTTSPGDVDIKIYDPYGRIIFRERGNPNQQYMLGRDIPTGIYYVHVTQGAYTQVIKILKQN
jgi:hypothetical protein